MVKLIFSIANELRQASKLRGAAATAKARQYFNILVVSVTFLLGIALFVTANKAIIITEAYVELEKKHKELTETCSSKTQYVDSSDSGNGLSPKRGYLIDNGTSSNVICSDAYCVNEQIRKIRNDH